MVVARASGNLLGADLLLCATVKAQFFDLSSDPGAVGS
jgi:hypothetical protein